MVRFFQYILLSCLICFGIQCQVDEVTMEEKESFLSVVINDVIHKDFMAVYHRTFPRDSVLKYLDNGFSIQQVRFMIQPPDSLSLIFNDDTFRKLNQQINNYDHITIPEEINSQIPIVSGTEIPLSIRMSTPPDPDRKLKFLDVGFFSTPIVSDSTGIVLYTNYSNDIAGLRVLFYVKTNGKWKYLFGGSLKEATELITPRSDPPSW